MTQHDKRIHYMQLLYQYDLSLHMEKKPGFLIEDEQSPDIDDIILNLDRIDQMISACLTNYRINRLSYVDRAIIRLATYEMAHLKLEPEIAINEALILTRTYSMLDDEKQVKFNNKLLDTIAKYIKEQV